MLRNIGKMLAALDVGRHLNALKISTSKLHPFQPRHSRCVAAAVIADLQAQMIEPYVFHAPATEHAVDHHRLSFTQRCQHSLHGYPGQSPGAASEDRLSGWA
jgi:hypothetical protein